MNGGVREMRLVVTAPDYEAALAFYRDLLGMPEIGLFTSPGGRVTILDAGRATLELGAGHIRVGLQVADASAATDRAVAAGAEQLVPPTETPWRSLNARLNRPAGLQLTLFEELDPDV